MLVHFHQMNFLMFFILKLYLEYHYISSWKGYLVKNLNKPNCWLFLLLHKRKLLRTQFRILLISLSSQVYFLIFVDSWFDHYLRTRNSSLFSYSKLLTMLNFICMSFNIVTIFHVRYLSNNFFGKSPNLSSYLEFFFWNCFNEY